MTKRISVTALCWLARIWFIASVGLLCAFLVGEGLPPLTVKSLLFPFGVMLGLVLAWRFERIGGLIGTASMLLFYALEYLGHGRFPGGYAFMLVSAPSVIFLCCGYLRARQIRNTNAESARRD